MPELPEVETIRRDLLPHVVGRAITGVRVAPGASRVIRDVVPRSSPVASPAAASKTSFDAASTCCSASTATSPPSTSPSTCV